MHASNTVSQCSECEQQKYLLQYLSTMKDKNCSLSPLLTATHQKLQKIIKTDITHLYVNVILSNITFVWFLQFLMLGC